MTTLNKADVPVLQRWMDQGRCIEAGWMTFRRISMHPQSPPQQVREMRIAFYCAAQFLFHAMMLGMQEGTEPTDADLKRMARIDAELAQFDAEYRRVGVDQADRAQQRSCARCGKITHHPKDVEQGYCGACHDWTW